MFTIGILGGIGGKNRHDGNNHNSQAAMNLNKLLLSGVLLFFFFAFWFFFQTCMVSGHQRLVGHKKYKIFGE